MNCEIFPVPKDSHLDNSRSDTCDLVKNKKGQLLSLE